MMLQGAGHPRAYRVLHALSAACVMVTYHTNVIADCDASVCHDTVLASQLPCVSRHGL